ncbi:MAG: 16S rRNA processing protein RimM [Kordiimonadaceae bacterium]|jgi:16S rRNA processing protein RimM|nr:16S rRNA processing protein RimM [Kordiimonadaceae bacterium]MBT6032926.1 16S rRNA processing protein RimM [Kordiimonadaceae bacterium]
MVFSAHNKASHNADKSESDMVCLGAVFGAAGVRGAVRLKVFTEQLNSISDYGPLTVFGPEFPKGKKFPVKILHNVKGGVAVKLQGVDDRDLADALKGSKLYIDRAALPEIKNDNGFYFEDLVGLLAKDENDNVFGKIDGVFNFGAGDIIEVNFNTEKGKRMYPFSDEIVPKVDMEAGFVVINREAFGDGLEETETD